MIRNLSLLLALFLTSCGLSEEECKAGNWIEIGQRDGANGRDRDFIDFHEKRCSKFQVTVDEKIWLVGHSEGLKSYCIPSEAYGRSARGQTFKTFLCDSKNAEKLSKAALQGERYFRISQKINSLENERATLLRELAELPTDGSKEASRASLSSRISWLDFEIRQLISQRSLYAHY